MGYACLELPSLNPCNFPEKIRLEVSPETVLFVVGPTAAGKSSFAIQMAKKLNGEIISADSMQVYRGMNIGTGKLTQSQQKKIPHHLINICSPAANFSVFDFYHQAIKTIQSVKARKKTPMIVGGTGLYVRSLLQGLELSVPPNKKIRERLEGNLKQKGLAYLVRQLKTKCPASFNKVDLKNPRRVIRALEKASLLRKKKHAQASELPSLEKLGMTPIVICLTCEREVLYKRIEARVDEMVRLGWCREVQRLSRKRISKTAKQAIGYRQFIEYFRSKDRTQMDVSKIIAQIKTDTRRYAKRQMTWFRNEKVDYWLAFSEKSPDSMNLTSKSLF